MSIPFRALFDPRAFLEGFAAVVDALPSDALRRRVARRVGALSDAQRLALHAEARAVLCLETTAGEPLDRACLAVTDAMGPHFHAAATRLAAALEAERGAGAALAA